MKGVWEEREEFEWYGNRKMRIFKDGRFEGREERIKKEEIEGSD